MNVEFDSRTKILSVAVLSGIVVFSSDLLSQSLVLILTIILCLVFNVDIADVSRRMNKYLMPFLLIIIIQSVFVKGQNDIISIGSFVLLSNEGLKLGINYALRLLVIIFCGAIISSSSMRKTVQGMAQMGLPYELALMTSIGVRFLPILMDEIKQTHIAMELRGIDVKKIPLSKRIDLIGRLFMPIVNITLMRAKSLSESIDMRGFAIGGKRSSYYELIFNRYDKFLLLCVLSLVSIIVYVCMTAVQ